MSTTETTGNMDSMLEKMTSVLSKVMGQREESQRAVRAATAILREEPPPAFDHEAAGRAVAQARVDDLVMGGSTADAVGADVEKQRAATVAAITKHERRITVAQQQLDQATSFLQALTAQAREIDTAIRREFASASQEWEADAEAAMGRSAVKFLMDYVNYKAVTWLRFTERPGDARKQFSWPDQYEVTLSVPPSIIHMLPDGYHHGPGEAIVYRKYEVAQLINERVNEIMGANSEGIYPKIAASLANQDS